MRVPLRIALLLLALPACTVTREPLPLPSEFFIISAEDQTDAERKHAWIGLEVGLNESEDLMALELRPGVRVVAVEPDSPADRAGLRLGDVLLTLDGVPVNDPGRLEVLLSNIGTPRRVSLEVERGAQLLVTLVEPEIHSSRAGRSLGWIERALLRVAVRNGASTAADPQGRWPEIAGFGPESPLESAGARAGDRIVSFQGADAGSAETFVRRIGSELQPGDEVRMELLGADGARRSVEFDAWSPGTALTRFGFWPLYCWERSPEADRGQFWLGDLLIVYVFHVERVGAEKEYSILGLIRWGTGEALLQEDPVLEIGAKPAPAQF